MKVIFLDIDGVVNCMYTKQRLRGIIFVDPRKIQLVKGIVDATGALIVLTSTWRSGWYDIDNHVNSQNATDFISLRDEFNKVGLDFFDKTERSNDGYRGKEISMWLENHPEVTNYVIIDDDTDIKPHGLKFIQTSWQKGICQKHVIKAIKILGDK